MYHNQKQLLHGYNMVSDPISRVGGCFGGCCFRRIRRRKQGKPLDRRQVVLGSQVCVAHRHLDCLVSHQLSHSANVHACHNQSAGKCVPHTVPGEIRDSSVRHRLVKPMLVTLKLLSL